jgi:hypothetical protein
MQREQFIFLTHQPSKNTKALFKLNSEAENFGIPFSSLLLKQH